MKTFLKQEIAESAEVFSPLPPRAPVQKVELGSAGTRLGCRVASPG
jgi:hypothetical protein